MAKGLNNPAFTTEASKFEDSLVELVGDPVWDLSDNEEEVELFGDPIWDTFDTEEDKDSSDDIFDTIVNGKKAKEEEYPTRRGKSIGEVLGGRDRVHDAERSADRGKLKGICDEEGNESTRGVGKPGNGLFEARAKSRR